MNIKILVEKQSIQITHTYLFCLRDMWYHYCFVIFVHCLYTMFMGKPPSVRVLDDL